MNLSVLAYSAGDWRVLNAGGNLTNGTHAGFGYLNANNTSSNDNSNISARPDAHHMKGICRDCGPCQNTKDCPARAGRVRPTVRGRMKQEKMKRYNNLYEKIVAYPNIELAHTKARRGKRHYAAVKKIDENPEMHLTNLWQTLCDRQHKTSDYSVIKRQVGKKTRIIYKLPYYPDRIVHHCIMNVLEPIWLKVLIRDTYSAIKGRGVHDGVKRMKGFLQDKRNTKYCLKLDVKKFYPSIDHEILKQIIRRKIKCKDTLALLDEIIGSAPGVPIGNYLSQYFGNLYLAYFDHYCKEVLGIKYYARYCDDVVVFHSEKDFLHSAFHNIADYLKSKLGLAINGNHQVFPTRVRGVDFLGYRFFGGYTLVRKSIATTFKQKMKQEQPVSCIMSYKGWLGHANAYRLWHAHAPNLQGVV